MEMSLKNYIFALILLIATVALTLFLAKLYEKQKIYENENNKILNSFSEIKKDEIDNYIIENHDVMILLTDENQDNKEILNNFKNIITNNNYIADIVYLKLENSDNELKNKIKNNYFSSKILDKNIELDCLLIIKDGIVINAINLNKQNINNLKNIIESEFYKI